MARGPVRGDQWFGPVIIGLVAVVGLLVVQSNLEHARRHEAFLTACARAGHDSGRCDFYWLTLAARAPSNDKALSVISSTPK